MKGRAPARKRSHMKEVEFVNLYGIISGELDVAARTGVGGSIAAKTFAARAADAGVSVSEVIAELERAWAPQDPPHNVMKAAMTTWSERMSWFAFGASCVDPLTQMASAGHLREAICSLQRRCERENIDFRENWCLLSIELCHPMANGLEAAISAIDVGLALRTVFPADEVIASLTPRNFAVLVERVRVDEDLLAIVAVLMRRAAGVPSPRVRVIDIPVQECELAQLLDSAH